MWCVTPLYICTQSILLWICTRYLNKLPCNYPLGIYLVDCNIIKSTQSWMWLVVIKNRIIMSINDFNYLCIMYIHSLLERTTCIYCNYRWNVTYTEYASNSFGNTAFQGIVDHLDHRNILYTCSKYFSDLMYFSSNSDGSVLSVDKLSGLWVTLFSLVVCHSMAMTMWLLSYAKVITSGASHMVPLW